MKWYIIFSCECWNYTDNYIESVCNQKKIELLIMKGLKERIQHIIYNQIILPTRVLKWLNS